MDQCKNDGEGEATAGHREQRLHEKKRREENRNVPTTHKLFRAINTGTPQP